MYFNLDSYIALKIECRSCLGKVRRKLAEIFGTLGYYESISIVMDFEIEILKNRYRNTIVTKDILNSELNNLVFNYLLNEVDDTPLMPSEIFDGNVLLIAIYDIVFFDGQLFKNIDSLSDCVDYWKEEAGYLELLHECEMNKYLYTVEEVDSIKQEGKIRELINLYIRNLYERVKPGYLWSDSYRIKHLIPSLGCKIIGIDDVPENEANNIIEDWVMF